VPEGDDENPILLLTTTMIRAIHHSTLCGNKHIQSTIVYFLPSTSIPTIWAMNIDIIKFSINTGTVDDTDGFSVDRITVIIDLESSAKTSTFLSTDTSCSRIADSDL